MEADAFVLLGFLTLLENSLLLMFHWAPPLLIEVNVDLFNSSDGQEQLQQQAKKGNNRFMSK